MVGICHCKPLLIAAIAHLLRQPIQHSAGAASRMVSSSGFRAPSTRDIPPVSLTNIPHVENSAFDSYFAQTGSLYDLFRRSAVDEPEIRKGRETRKDPYARPSYSRAFSSSSDVVPSSPTSPSFAPSPASRSPRRQPRRRKGPASVTPLSTVPAVYFDSDFQLENPRIFDVVSEHARASSASPPEARRNLANNAILQEKLSWYMDTIEVHLISAISTASASFFAALGDLRSLHDEAAESVTQIQRLQAELAHIDKEVAQGGLKVVALRRRKDNVRKLQAAVRQVEQIVQAINSCEKLVQAGNVEAALDQSDKISTSLQTDPLTGEIVALQDVGQQVGKLRLQIGQIYEDRFLSSLLTDLRQHVDAVSPEETVQRWEVRSRRLRGGPASSALAISDKQRDHLQKNLQGLARCGTLKQATISYRDALWREIKLLIRRHLPSSTDDDLESSLTASTRSGLRVGPQEKSSILARNLRDLEAADAETMLEKIYTNVGEALRRLAVQVKVVLDITSMLPSHASEQEEVQQALDMTNLLGQAVDSAQTQISKILRVRMEQTVSLTLPYFLQYFRVNRLFADECEAVSGRGGAMLKDIISAHIKEFVRRFSIQQRQHLTDHMDAERWNIKEPSATDIKTLHDIIAAATDQEESTEGASITISGTTYTLPESAFSVLEGIACFEQMIDGMPSMTMEGTTALLDYLKAFNSRSQQLVLGAGATRLAGLKNITTKHLALVSQSLDMILGLLPLLRNFVKRHIANPQGLMIEFDKVSKLYQEHQSGIKEKLVEIMSSRAAAHVSAMKKTDWNSSNDAVSPHMETLIKETTTLHKVLSKLLSETTVQAIMRPVFANYQEQWCTAFEHIEAKSSIAQQRLVREAEYFKTRMAKIDGGAGVGDAVLAVAKTRISVNGAVSGIQDDV